MQTFTITVQDTQNKNNFAIAQTYYTEDDEKTPEAIVETIERAINSRHELEFQDGDRFITISPASDDEGYFYDVYESKEAYDQNEDSVDGGQCTGTLSDAITMALN